MLKKVCKFLVLFVAVLLVLGLSLTGCKQPAAEKPAGTLSFEAAEYTNAEHRFSVKYPKDWKEVPDQIKEETVFYAASEKRVPVLSVSVRKEATFAEALTAGLSKAGSDIKIVTERAATLAEGTTASEAVVKWKVQGIGADTFALGVKKGDKWVIVAITTVSLLSKYDEALFSEIAHTLKFKK